MMLFSSGNAPRKIEEKWSFLLYFARFALSLMLRIQCTHVRKNKRNKYFLSFFVHLIVPLTLRVQDRLHLGNAKEKRVFLLYFARFALSLQNEKQINKDMDAIKKLFAKKLMDIKAIKLQRPKY